MYICIECANAHLTKHAKTWGAWATNYGKCNACEKDNKLCMNIPDNTNWAWVETATKEKKKVKNKFNDFF